MPGSRYVKQAADELNEMAAFSTTPTSQKFITKMPTLLSKGVQIGQDAVAANLPELEKAFLTESQRLKELDEPVDDGGT